MSDFAATIATADALAEHVLGAVGLWSVPAAPPWLVARSKNVGGRDDEIPIAVAALADALQVAVIPTELAIDGRLTLTARGPIAHIDSRPPETRRAFTVAHEIAHWLLAGKRWAPTLATRAERAFSNQERCCDALAASLLMPREWVIAASDGQAESLTVLEDVSGLARVSLSAGLLRLHHVAGWRAQLVHLRRVRGRWVVDADAGLRRQERGYVRVTHATTERLDELGLGRWSDERVRLTVRGRPVVASADLHLGLRRGVALIRPAFPSAGRGTTWRMPRAA